MTYRLLIIGLVTLAVGIKGLAQTFPLPDIPPRASLIEVSSPTVAGEVTVTGRPGAVPANNIVITVTMDTGHFAYTQAAADGSFRLTTFAPYGTSIMVKADPTGETLNRALREIQSGGEGALASAPATILRVADPPAAGEGIRFGGAGLVFDASPSLPVWTFQGTIGSQELVPGDTLRVQGIVRVESPMVATAGTIRTGWSVNFHRLSASDGNGVLAASIFASTLLTPTGFPIERHPIGFSVGLTRGGTLTLSKVGPERAEATVDFTLTLPSDLPQGYYRPVLWFCCWEGLQQERPPSRPVIGTEKPSIRRRDQTYLPIVRIGNPEPPRLYWTLLTDTLSNGTRGARAVEDRGRFGLATRIVTDSEKFIIPRIDPASGQPLTYRLEPFTPAISRGDRGIVPSVPLIPFRFPSGRLTVRVQQPDGSIRLIGPAPFLQSRQKTLVDQRGQPLDQGGGHLTDVFELSTMDPRFEVQFTQDGLHIITLESEIEDIWGNTWRGGGTYEIYVARMLSLDTAVLPGTPFEVGDVFAPSLVMTPPVPAEVEVRLCFFPNSEPSRVIERTVRGLSSRFGYFHPPGSAVLLQDPGEYRVDVTASFRDSQGNLWMGSRTWGGVVAPRNPAIIAHGRRGIDDFPGAQWFFRNQTTSVFGSGHVFYPFHTGDITWQERLDAALPLITIQDTGTAIADLLRARAGAAGYGRDFEARATAGEMPLFLSTVNGRDAHLDASQVELWGYSYRSVQRPLVRVREEISDDGAKSLYWRFLERYANQIGMGPSGDLPNDIKFQYGAAVLRGPLMPRPEYAIYGSLFVLVPDTNNPRGGTTRTFPPFQGNGGGPSGGPIMRLKGRDIDLFIHLTGVRPGSVLETGDTFALAGAVGPPLPAQVSYTVAMPSGQQRQFSARANKVGYYYRPEHDFVVQEPGIYTVDLLVTFDGQTSAGQVTQPFPTGDVLGTANGRFYFYVVPRDSLPLSTNQPQGGFLSLPISLDVTANAGAGFNITGGHVTTTMPGFLLHIGSLAASGSQLSYNYVPELLWRDFPNLDVSTGMSLPGPGLPPAAADVITISLFASGTAPDGRPAYAARLLVLHGAELLNPDQAVVKPVPAALVNAASFTAGAPLVPGSIASLFGTNLSSLAASAVNVPLPTTLGTATVRLNDVATPLFYASPLQVNLQVPWELAGQTQASLTAAVGGIVSSPLTVPLAPYAPAIFTVGGSRQGAILIAGTSSVAAPEGSLPGARPVRRSEFLAIYSTGLGQVANRPQTGASAPDSPPATTTTMPMVTLGGVPAPVSFSGLAPGFVGLYQVNVEVPENVPTGNAVPLVLTIGGAASNIATVAIQ